MLVVLGVGVGWEPSPLRTPCLELSARRRGLRERRAPCSAARPLCTLHTASVRADTVDTLHPDHLLDGDTLAGVYRL